MILKFPGNPWQLDQGGKPRYLREDLPRSSPDVLYNVYDKWGKYSAVTKTYFPLWQLDGVCGGFWSQFMS